MPKVTFVTESGEAVSCDARTGLSLMEVAVDNDVAGVVAECGGACACATCHVYVADNWLGQLPAMDDMEDTMLDAAADRRPNSRLSCQLEMSDALDGLTVTVADNNA